MKPSSPFILSRTSAAMALLTSATILASLTPARADDAPTKSEIDDLRAEITALQARLDRIESKQVVVAANASAPTASVANGTTGLAPAGSPAIGLATVKAPFPIQVSGLFQEQLNLYSSEKGTPSQRGFRTRRAEVRITAPRVTDHVSATVNFDVAKNAFGKTFAPGEAAATPGLNTNGVLQDFVLSYRFSPRGSSTNAIDVGQFKIPLGYEGDLVSSSALDETERAQIFRARDISGGGFGDIRDQGILLHGTTSQNEFGYDLAVMQGLGELQNQTGSADPKAFVGRIRFSPARSGLTFGVSGARGDNSGPLASPIAPSTASIVTPLRRNFENAFVVYKRNKLGLQAEYTNGHTSALPATPLRYNAHGYYVGGTYLLSQKFQLVGRYDWLDIKSQKAGSAATVDGASTEASAGINYFLRGNNAKLQADLVQVLGENGALSNSNALQLRTEFQVAF